MFEKVESVLEEEVRPYLKQHYGNVQLVSVYDGVARIKLTGQCKNCPSARLTVENIIETALRSNLKDIKEVVLINEVSEELIEIARKLLRHETDEMDHVRRAQ
ncbi:MAG TPA: NifU family protein [Negativicutes bacterium]|nr:NifU family protein [Negativicutes bacterium]